MIPARRSRSSGGLFAGWRSKIFILRTRALAAGALFRYNVGKKFTGAPLRAVRGTICMDLKGKNFLTLRDFTPDEITGLIDLAADLKAK